VHRRSDFLGQGGGGGAIYHGGKSGEIVRCCFLETKSDDYGTALFLSGSNGAQLSSSSTFSGCTDNGLGTGTIYCEVSTELVMTYTNFSSCALSVGLLGLLGEGSVLCVESSGGSWKFAFSTVWRCSGLSDIETSVGPLLWWIFVTFSIILCWRICS
jgi:hypothetical protein